jgi:hypothetical protein
MKYSQFSIEKGLFKHRKHIYFLVGYEKDANCGYVVASYSLKTKYLIIKDIDIIGYNNVLVDFVKIIKEKRRDEV